MQGQKLGKFLSLFFWENCGRHHNFFLKFSDLGAWKWYGCFRKDFNPLCWDKIHVSKTFFMTNVRPSWCIMTEAFHNKNLYKALKFKFKNPVIKDIMSLIFQATYKLKVSWFQKIFQFSSIFKKWCQITILSILSLGE